MDLINRLKYYMETIGVPISQFADNCGIPRPSLSQLLNGRNKRISDDVINKIHNAYPDLSILWLMFGEGEMRPVKNIEISEPQDNEESVKPDAQTADKEGFVDSISNNSTFENISTDIPYSDNTLFGGQISEEIVQPKDNLSPTKENINFGGQTVSSIPNRETTSRDATNMNHGLSAEGSMASEDNVMPAMEANTLSSSGGETPVGNQTYSPLHNRRVAITPDSRKKITNIVVFYSDNSFQSFLPDA